MSAAWSFVRSISYSRPSTAKLTVPPAPSTISVPSRSSTRRITVRCAIHYSSVGAFFRDDTRRTHATEKSCPRRVTDEIESRIFRNLTGPTQWALARRRPAGVRFVAQRTLHEECCIGTGWVAARRTRPVEVGACRPGGDDVAHPLP